MDIDSVQRRSDIYGGDLERSMGAGKEDRLSLQMADQSSTSSWVEALSTASDFNGDALRVAQLVTNSNGTTSTAQAQTFEFLAILGKVLRGVADFLRGEPPTTGTRTSTTTAKNDVGADEVAPDHDNGTARSPSFASNAKAMMNAAAPRQGSNATTTSVGVESRAHAQGELTSGRATLEGQADARAFATAKSSSSTCAGLDGAGAVAEAEARVGVEASASGSITSDFGDVSGTVHASAELYARAQAYAMANGRGAHAGADVEVGAEAEVDAKVDASTLGGNVTVHGEGVAEAGAGAKAQAKVGLSADPLEAAVNAKAGAFAGARAGFEADGGVAGVKYGVSGELRAGVGLNAELNAGIEDGKVKFSFGFGVSVGIGFSIKFDVEIDFKAVGKAIGDFFGAIASLFGGHLGDGRHAGDAISQFLASMPTMQEQARRLSSQFDSESSRASDTTESDRVEGEIALGKRSTRTSARPTVLLPSGTKAFA